MWESSGLHALCASDRVFGSWFWTILDGNIDWKSRSWTGTVFPFEFLRHWESALCGLVVVLESKKWAVTDQTSLAGAGVDGIAKELGRIPAHNEIAVVAGTDWVTSGDEELAWHAGEILSGPNGLEKEEWVVVIVAIWAVTLLDKRWVCHVRSVVGRVELTCTARWESHLHADTVGAVGIHVIFRWELVAVEGRLGSPSIVEAVESNSTLLQEKLVARVCWPLAQLLIRLLASEVAKLWVASNHGKAFWERLHLIEVEQVVCKHAANVWHHLDSAIFVLEVNWWSPVGRLVLFDATGGAIMLGVGALRKAVISRVGTKVFSRGQ